MAWYNKIWRKVESYDVEEADIGIGNSKISIRPNVEDMQIAYKLWVELSTRKIGLDIDLENDVIIEIYDSWYEFFILTRELIKSIPVSKIRKNQSTKKIVNLAIEVLNVGVRPHLTKWQARFRRWYTSEIEKDKSCNFMPQDCQKKFPQYKELTEDLLIVNKRLIEYREYVRKLALD